MWESIFLINQTKVKEIPPPNKEKTTHTKKNKTPKKNLNKKTQLNLH